MRNDLLGQQYFDELSDLSTLDKDKERRLIRKFKKEGDIEARNKVLKAALKFVVATANHFSKNKQSKHRLICAGNEGLMKAIEEFDLEKSNQSRFTTYAFWHVTEYMRQQLRDENIIREPRWVHSTRKKIKDYMKQSNESWESITSDDLSEFMNMSEKQLEKFLNQPECSTIPKPSLDRDLPDDSEVEEKTKQKDLSNIVNDVLDEIGPRERFVVCAYYGIGMKDHTYYEIGNYLGVSNERVRQICANARDKIREHLEDQKSLHSLQDIL